MAPLTLFPLFLSLVSSALAQTYSSTLSTVTTSALTALALPTTPYTGQALLTGSCDHPQYTPIQFADGGQLIVPLIGCSDEHPECCPSLSHENETEPAETVSHKSESVTIKPTGVLSMLSQHPLSICPHDFTDIDPVCCPSGYSLYGRPLAGNLPPCYTQLTTSVSIPPSVLASISSSAAEAQTITDTVTLTQTASPSTTSAAPVQVSVDVIQIFALPLPCQAASTSTLSLGAKIGIGVGVGVAALVGVALIWFLCIRHRRRKEEKENKGRGTIGGRSEPMDPGAAQMYRAQQQGTIGGAYFDQQLREKHLSGTTVGAAAPGSPPLSPPSGSAGQGDYAQGYMHGVHSAMAIAQSQQPQGARSPPGYSSPGAVSTGSAWGTESQPRIIDGGELAGRERLEMEGDRIVRKPVGGHEAGIGASELGSSDYGSGSAAGGPRTESGT